MSISRPDKTPSWFKRNWRRHGTAILRWANGIMSVGLAVAFLVHTWFQESLAWLTPDFKTAIAIALFAFLIDRILVVHRSVSESPLVVCGGREEAYENLLQLIYQYGATSVDMLQFSGQTVLPLLRGIAQTGRAVKVRLFLAHPSQAAQFDTDWDPGKQFHVDRTRNTLLNSKLVCQDHKNLVLETFYYRPPAGLSAVIVDDWIVSVGWYHCYEEEKESATFLRIRGHAAPAINVTGYKRDALISFVREQITNIAKHAETVSI